MWTGPRLLLLLLGLAATTVIGFQPAARHYDVKFGLQQQRQQWTAGVQAHRTSLFSVSGTDEDEETPSFPKRFRSIIKNTVKKVVPRSFQKSLPRIRFGVSSLALATAVLTGSVFRIQPARASAPVMALPKAEGRDPVTEAMGVHDRKMAAQAQRELTEMAVTARQIEAEQGESARVRFEKEFKEAQVQKAAAKIAGLQQLKRELLDQGLCPFTDMEGQRQVVAYEKGVDLAKVQGTPFYLEKEWETKSPARSMKVKKAANRQVIACMVQDMKNRGIDPLDYFEKHQDQTEAILDMSAEQAARLVQQYQANLEEYGQITVPKEGELSAKEKLAQLQKNDPRIAKEEAKRLKAEAKAKAAEQKHAAKAEKARLQAEAKAAKLSAKQEANRMKEQAKQAAVAAASAGIAGAAGAVQETAEGISDNLSLSSPQDTASMEQQQQSLADSNGEFCSIDPVAAAASSSTASAAASTRQTTTSSTAVIPKAVVAFAVAGGGGYAVKVYREKAAADEEQRQKQLRLLMNGVQSSSPTPAPALEEMETTTFSAKPVKQSTSVKKSISSPVPSPSDSTATTTPTTTKKKGLGIKNVFGKKKSERETDLMALVSSKANAPEFATTLAKILTFGAPGRFPSVLALPGGMPLNAFELESAKQILVDAQEQAGLTVNKSAEVFANVVNCMLIDIVDLASTSLKEKDDMVTIDAINIVVDFMNHAATLYSSIAEGVTINPVTYGGDLSKSKLEQMYSTYASSAMLNMANVSEDFDARVSMLQDVFQINAKKAEGLAAKAMQKRMMEMLKDGKGMEGMEEMMKSMGGLDGLAGLGTGADGDGGEGPSPEELMQMLTSLKELKDSGSIPPEEFDTVKKQFHEAFGSSIDDVVKEADANNEELSSTDQELLKLMKSIMD